MAKIITPSDTNPFELDKNCFFYSDYYIIDGKKIFYKDIACIIWKSSKKNMNGYNLNSNTDYMVLATKENYIPDMTSSSFDSKFYACDDFSYQTGIIKTHRDFLKRQAYIHSFLFEISRQHRFEKTINSLSKYGYLSPNEEIKIFDNGDLFLNEKLEGNLVERHKAGKIINGVKYGGYNNKVSNPYEFGFVKSASFFGIFENRFVFQNICNYDIMDILFNNLFQKGKLSNF